MNDCGVRFAHGFEILRAAKRRPYSRLSRIVCRAGAALSRVQELLFLSLRGRLRPWLRSRWRLCRLTDAAYPLRVQSRNYRLRNDFERIRYIKKFC